MLLRQMEKGDGACRDRSGDNVSETSTVLVKVSKGAVDRTDDVEGNNVR
jgi:hypothetical protein